MSVPPVCPIALSGLHLLTRGKLSLISLVLPHICVRTIAKKENVIMDTIKLDLLFYSLLRFNLIFKLPIVLLFVQ